MSNAKVTIRKDGSMEITGDAKSLAEVVAQLRDLPTQCDEKSVVNFEDRRDGLESTPSVFSRGLEEVVIGKKPESCAEQAQYEAKLAEAGLVEVEIIGKTKKLASQKAAIESAESESLVTCAICGHKSWNISNWHLPRDHGMTVAEYRKKFPGFPVICKARLEMLMNGRKKRAVAQKASKAKKSPPKPVEGAKKRGRPKRSDEEKRPAELMDIVKEVERRQKEAEQKPVPESKPCPEIDGEPEPVDPRDLYVSNLPYDATETDIEDLFSQFGKVLQTKILYDSMTGTSKGKAFVRMSDAIDATVCLKRFNDGKYVFLGGRHIYVSRAATKPYRERV